MKNIKNQRDVVTVLQIPNYSTVGRCNPCTGRDGKQKSLYETKVDASNAAVFVKDLTGGSFKVYHCPYTKKGWHIAKDFEVDKKKKKPSCPSGLIDYQPKKVKEIKPEPKNVWRMTKAGFERVKTTTTIPSNKKSVPKPKQLK